MWRALFLFVTLPLFGLSIKEKLSDATAGSYVVTSQDKSATFLFIRSNEKGKLLMEEVSIPMSRAPTDWKGWFESGAPGHTLWTSSLVNLKKGELEETFSFTHEGWIDQTEANDFFSTLLNLSFREIPETNRKKVGFPPKHGQEDKRTLWEPRLVVDGKIKKSVHFEAFETRWPNDHTELARRKIEIYFPGEGQSFFPHWIEVDGKVTTVRMHVIDSGKEARSPKPKLPYRRPQMIGSARHVETGIEILVKSPDYFTDFHVLAEDAEDYYKRPMFLKSTFENGVIFIPNEELAELDGSYFFVVSPKEAPECTITSPKPLIINKTANS